MSFWVNSEKLENKLCSQYVKISCSSQRKNFFTTLSLVSTVKMILKAQEKHIMFKTKHLLTKDFLDLYAFLFILCPGPCEIIV